MRDKHIVELLDNVPLEQLSDSELARIRGHVGHCSQCRQAFQAADVSALILRERAAASIEPSPYFRTRVMAAIREKRGGLEPFSFLRMWKASGSLVYSMVALVVMLAALTYFQSGSQTEGDLPDLTASLNANAREWAVFGPDTSVEDKMTYDQVLTDIYDNESEREDPDGNRR